jgi:hypothetical protein
MRYMLARCSIVSAAHFAAAAAVLLAAPLVRADGVRSGAGPNSPGVEGHAESQGSGTKESGIIPGVLIGPRIGSDLPAPTIGVEAKVLRYFGASFEYAFFPKIGIAGASLGYSMWNASARVYPFGGAFFIGGVYGHYGIEGSVTSAQGSGAVRVNSTFLGPQLGARWVQPSGFFAGIDVAWAFPLAYSSASTPDPSGTMVSIQHTADRYLQHGVPLVGASLGWLF